MTIELVEIGQVVDELGEFEEVLRTWGLHRRPDRLSRSKDALVRLDRMAAEGMGEEIRGDLALWLATADAYEFWLVHRYLRPLDRVELEAKFQKALKGPMNPLDEREDDSNEGRNTLFELLVGGAFRRAGAHVDFEQPTDVGLTLGCGRVLIECKRPFREAGVRRNIGRAYSQAITKLDGASEGTVVVAALSLTRAMLDGLVERGALPLDVQDESKLPAFTEALQCLFRSGWDDRDLPDCRLVAGISHSCLPVRVETHRCIVAAQSTAPIVRHRCMEAVWSDGGEEFVQTLRRAFG